MSRNLLALLVPSSPSLSSAFTAALRQAIASHAGETHHPDAFASDIAALVDMRAHVGAMEDHAASLDAAYRYHAQLVFAATKLPAVVPIAFPWSQPLVQTSILTFAGGTGARFIDSASQSASELASVWNRSEHFAVVCDGTVFVGHPFIAWERANVLYAIGALIGSLAAQESRSDGASIKRAIAYFQTSSAVFSHLESQVMPAVLPQLSYTSPSHGLHLAALRSLSCLMLAQAQECVWQKAVSDGMKSGTVAKLAKGVEELYEQTLDEARRAESEDAVEALPRTWINHLTVKRCHFGAAAQFRKSQEDLSNSRYGDEIARLQLAEMHVRSGLAALKKGLVSSASADTIGNDLRSLQGVIDSNIKRARKDNDLIYLEPITPTGSLAALSAARMVQPKLPVEVAKPIDCLRPRSAAAAAPGLPALGRPLFGALVPYGAHLAISVYEDRKETWWRSSVEEKRQELEALVGSTFESLSLPAALDALESPGQDSRHALPANLLDQVDRIVRAGGVDRLRQIQSDVQQMAQLNADNLERARATLEAESEEDASVRAKFAGGSSRQWGRQESGVAAQGYRRRLDELAHTLSLAKDSDAVVRSKVDKWMHSWTILQGGEAAIMREMPAGADARGGAGGSGLTTTSNPVVRDIRKTMETIDDTLAEFASLSSETRTLVRSDDIREKVMREVGRLSSSSSSSGDPTPGTNLDLESDISPELFEGLFEAEFAKYRKVEDQLGALEAQVSALLGRLAAQNDAFTQHLRSHSSAQAARNAAMSNLALAAGKLAEVQSNLEEGLKFYDSLARMIAEFAAQVQAWREARNVDVQQLVKSLEGASVGGRAGGEAPPATPGKTRAPRGKPCLAAPNGRSASSTTDTPSRTTRARARAAQQQQQDEDEEGAGQEEEEEAHAGEGAEEAPRPPPQWGAWTGGGIQFAD